MPYFYHQPQCHHWQHNYWQLGLIGMSVLWGIFSLHGSVNAKPSAINAADCTYQGKPLYGKIQVVKSFPDLKVQIVQAFPDLKVQQVTAFPDKCGQWQFVESFPDLKIQFVESFPDLKIQYVNAFPGLR